MFKVQYDLYTGEVLYYTYSIDAMTFTDIINKLNSLGLNDYFIVGDNAFMKGNLRWMKIVRD